jgi:hypothetical protein
MSLRRFARIRMSALTSSHLAAYRDERLKVVSGTTVSGELSVLSDASARAPRMAVYLLVNPCGPVRRPPQGRPEIDLCRGEEERRLLGACRDARNAWLVHFEGTRHRVQADLLGDFRTS